MENNRNLSSIISKIRDEGPPGNGSAAAEATPVDAGAAEPLSAPATTAGHRTSRKLLLGLVLPLVAVVGVVLFAGSYTGYRDNGGITGIASVVGAWLKTLPGSAENGVVTGGIVAATGAVDEQLVRDLQVQQLDIMFRLDQLTDSVAALSETINKNWADNDTVITGLRQEQRAAIDAIEVAQCAFQAPQNRQRGEPGRAIALLLRHLGTDFAERLRERAVDLGRAVPRNQCAVAHDVDPRKGKLGPGRQDQRSRERQAEVAETGFDCHAGSRAQPRERSVSAARAPAKPAPAPP